MQIDVDYASPVDLTEPQHVATLFKYIHDEVERPIHAVTMLVNTRCLNGGGKCAPPPSAGCCYDRR
jgi:hypothetical protein